MPVQKTPPPSESPGLAALSGWRAPLLVALCLTAYFLAVQAPLFSGLHAPDAMKYADAARNFQRGIGLCANSTTPRNAIKFHFTERVPASQILERNPRYFGYPLALAGAFALLGANDGAALACAGALWVLCGVLVFLLGRRLFSEKVGGLATLLFALQAKTVGFALSATAEPLCMALFLGGGLLLLAERRLAPAAAAAGFLGAFSFYVRQPMYYITPIVLGGSLALRRDRRILAALLAVAGAAAAVTARSHLQPTLFPPIPIQFAGRPIAAEAAPAAPGPALSCRALLDRFGGLGMLVFSNRFPGHSLERGVVEVNLTCAEFGAELAAKARYNLGLLAGSLAWRTGAPLWMLCFLAAAVFTFGETAARRLTLTIALLFAVQIGISFVFFVMDRYFQIFIPLMALVIARALAKLLERAPGGATARGAIAAALILAASFPPPLGRLASRAIDDPAYADVDYRPAFAPIARLVQAHTAPEDIVFSDLPWMTGWYADRPCIWLPLVPADAYDIAKWVKVDWLLLTLQDPQSWEIWRDWLAARVANEDLPPHALGDWTFVDSTTVDGRGVYLFRRPGP